MTSDRWIATDADCACLVLFRFVFALFFLVFAVFAVAALDDTSNERSRRAHNAPCVSPTRSDGKVVSLIDCVSE